jgi:branched-chain amino acid aminotransferase
MVGEIVYVNGAFVHKDDAKISVFDHNFNYGDGVFEGLQAVSGGVFKLRRHIDRLYQSARFLAIQIPMTADKFMVDVLETARRNRLRDGYMRPVVSRGVGPVGVRNMNELGPPTVVIIAQHEKIEDRRSAFESGVSAHVASVRRIPPECIDPRVKSCNYINNILAYMEAKHAGAHTAIMLDTQGYVSEGYGNNLFAVKDGLLLTPPIGNILAGITRETVIELAAALELKTVERPMTVYDFVNADEVFESATMAELTPIVEIDGRKVGDGKVGQSTRRLHLELRTLMESGRESSPISNQ